MVNISNLNADHLKCGDDLLGEQSFSNRGFDGEFVMANEIIFGRMSGLALSGYDRNSSDIWERASLFQRYATIGRVSLSGTGINCSNF